MARMSWRTVISGGDLDYSPYRVERFISFPLRAMLLKLSHYRKIPLPVT